MQNATSREPNTDARGSGQGQGTEYVELQLVCFRLISVHYGLYQPPTTTTTTTMQRLGALLAGS